MKKTIKGFFIGVLVALILTASLGIYASGYRVGDVVGKILYTDIITYFNGEEIRSFNIDGYTAIVAEDLMDYGLTVNWDGKARTLHIWEQTTSESTPTSTLTPTPTPQPVVGTIAEPIPGQNDYIIPFQRYSFYNKKDIKIVVDKVIIGPDANMIMAFENMFNEKPTADREWRIYVFALDYVSCAADDELSAHNVINYDAFYTTNGSSVNIHDTGTLGDKYGAYGIHDVNLYPGGSNQVVIAMLVNKSDGAYLLRVPYNGGENNIWLLCE